MPLRNPFVLLLGFVALGGLALSCSDDEPQATCTEGSLEEGAPTGATCPSTSTLTYENFAQPFMEKYCTRCHSSELSGDARSCAPDGHDCDTEAAIFAIAAHIDEVAAAGPDAVNTAMPPSVPRPTEAERLQLGEWLACNRDFWVGE